MLANVSPNIIPGELNIIIRRLPILSIQMRAMTVKMKLVPETIKPTAVGWLNPMDAKRVAE